MRYITVPDTVAMLDPISGAALTGGEWTFQRSWLTALTVLASKNAMDALALVDLRAAGVDACPNGPGATFAVSDEAWQTVAPEFRRPVASVFGAAYPFCAETHIRAVIDAPTKAP